jgi:hypothetical protein
MSPWVHECIHYLSGAEAEAPEEWGVHSIWVEYLRHVRVGFQNSVCADSGDQDEKLEQLFRMQRFMF